MKKCDDEAFVMRIFLADDQSRVRYGLRILLEQQRGWRVIGEAWEAQDLLCQVEQRCPDVVLLDWGLPGLAGTDLIPTLRGICPELYVIVFSGRLEVREAALKSGCDVFVSKTDPPERLLKAIKSIYDFGKRAKKIVDEHTYHEDNS
ncbi:MAG: response regulator transcription factor [Anaerolineales bacterium]|jgi:two-component system invasion response regulator UvrY